MTMPNARCLSTLVPPLLPFLACGCATRAVHEALLARPIDPAKAVLSAEGDTAWFNALDIGIEGQGWTDLKHPYDRFPGRAEGVVPDAVWALSRRCAGMRVRFVTDSPVIEARWSLAFDALAMNHMPASGVSGLDLYAAQDGVWGWVGVGIPTKIKDNESKLLIGAPEGRHEYLLYLPLYNGMESLEIGVKPGSFFAQAPAYPSDRAKPILFWGTSILQGGCASRPGMAYPSIIGRRMQRPTLNLGFSGSGKMDPEVTALIAELDVSAYVIDCAPNMDADLITQRTEPLVHTLRKAHAETPIVLVECVPYQQAWYGTAKRESYQERNAALKAAYERLRAEGVKDLHYVPCDNLYGDDHEATVDGTHATDLGFLRLADAIEPVLRSILE